MSVHVFGIRHHGPGCARSLRAALKDLQPDIVLVEGPPDAQEMLAAITHEEMKPPVALLIYRPDNLKQAVYYPFTDYSPEWQAIHFAYQQAIPARFIDLPQAIQFAECTQDEADQEKAIDATGAEPLNATVQEEQADRTINVTEQEKREDPLALFAQAAGYSDHELWWERQIEQRQNVSDLFAGILEAMSALRADHQPKDEEEAWREAHMRQMICAAQQEGFQRIAVVCGAWHAPVLVDPAPAASADAKLLKGLKRVKVDVTWIPWANSRLSYQSGYGAGIKSPGWYEHLWKHPKHISPRWIARAAHLLRKEDLDASSASIIEAVRLVEALAAMRNLPMPGLEEEKEAIQTVLCHGNSEPMELIHQKLEIGERLGRVPAEMPTVPLQRDLEIQQRKLRFKPSLEVTQHDFDLRQDLDRARSRLLHQLRLLNIPWGQPQEMRGQNAGTFHEYWRVAWQVEYAIKLIEANVWGNTIEIAASAFVSHTAESLEELPQLTDLLDQTILAELPAAIEYLLQLIQKCAAVTSDVQHMMNALPPLARVARYSDVRQTKSAQVLPVIEGLFERIVIGLPGACSSLDDAAAQQMVNSIEHVNSSIALLNQDEQRAAWQDMLRNLMEQEKIHGFVRGRCCRLLLEQNKISTEELQHLTGHALSQVNPVAQAAAWIEGMLRGSGLTILHQDGLWHALDSWLSELEGAMFEAQLPILRRAFSGFQPAERYQMGEKVKHLHTANAPARQGASVKGHNVAEKRADKVLPILAHIMGVTLDGH